MIKLRVVKIQDRASRVDKSKGPAQDGSFVLLYQDGSSQHPPIGKSKLIIITISQIFTKDEENIKVYLICKTTFQINQLLTSKILEYIQFFISKKKT